MRIHSASSLSFILFYCSCFIIQISSASGHCLDDQKSLLLQFRNNLTFLHLNSSKLVSWNQSLEADCCKWGGVICDKEGRVTGLDLSREYIVGQLGNSSSLFYLRDLQNLNLAYNYFDSVIPSAFEKLTNLSYLNLSNACFVGQIPTEISHLTRLVILDISTSSNPIELALKLENPNLAKFVQNLTQVRELYLDGIIISDKGNEWSIALSSSLPDLQVLSMSSCNLSGSIDSSFQTLKNLSVIRLDKNNLSATVPAIFAKFSNLNTLHLSSCGLSGMFPPDIFKVETLTSLDISFNPDLHGYLPDFPQDGSLQRLILFHTNFSGAFSESIGNLRKLSRLECSNCQFNGTLPNSVSKLVELTYLDLSYNNFIGPIPSFRMAKKLTYIDLSYNHLSGEIPSGHFEGLQNLVNINLQSNSLNGSIPSSLFLLPSLQKIQISFNQFDRELNELSFLSNSALDTIDLSSNNLGGPIPMSFFHLDKLHTLKISSNKFSGIINLDRICSLKSLAELDLSYNNLSIDANVTVGHLCSFPNITSLGLASCKLSEFPTFLRNQSKLASLDLSNNQIQGKIPNWIWSHGDLYFLNLSHNLLTSFEEPFQIVSTYFFVLDLHSNKFRGQLPVLPLKFAYLDISSNKFNSVIPYDLGPYLSFTYFISLSNNSLHGTIPPSWCNAYYLVFDLSHNNLFGRIPRCLMKSQTLMVLNLQDNMLHGNIPDTVSELCDLRTLNLHGNQLSGPLPKSLANCKALTVLDLGRNHIEDEFPLFLMNVSTLRIIILRENKFQGPIGCPKKIGSLLMLHVVDLAFNNFSGKLPTKCFTTWKAMMLGEDQAAFELDHIQYRAVEYDRQTYYFDTVTVTIKGLQRELVKILNILTSIDFSSNHFEGPIPEELMNFKALHFLNLSHNSLSGQIPSSIGNLMQLESLDLSNNSLGGEIPPQLASLNFLSFLNLSFNNLEGRIPTGTQIQSFEATSFEGNQELCGPPLTENCSSGVQAKSNSTAESSFNWNWISSELGFAFGIGMVFMPLLFWKRWRLWYWKFVDEILCHIFPQLDFVHERHGGKNYRSLRWKRH